MKRFRVTGDLMQAFVVEIEAESLADAHKKASAMSRNDLARLDTFSLDDQREDGVSLHGLEEIDG